MSSVVGGVLFRRAAAADLRVSFPPDAGAAVLVLVLVSVLAAWYTFILSFNTGFIFLLLAFLTVMGYFSIWGVSRPVRIGQLMPSLPGFNATRVGDDLLWGVGLGMLFVVLSAGGVASTIPLPPAATLPFDHRFIAIVLLAPLVEEMTFRGLVAGGVTTLSGSVVLASVVSGFAFAAYHLLAYGTGFISAFLVVGGFGVAAVLVNGRGGRIGEGSLWAGWVAHTLYNGVTYARMTGVGG